MDTLAHFVSDNLNFNFLNLKLSPDNWRAVAIVFLLFILIVTLARFRKHMIDWSLRGAVFGVFFGFLFALILEGFLIIGGKTALTEVLGWKNAPKPLQLALDSGKGKLIDVLGVSTSIPSSMAKENMSTEEVVGILQSLNPDQRQQVESLICKP